MLIKKNKIKKIILKCDCGNEDIIDVSADKFVISDMQCAYCLRMPDVSIEREDTEKI